MLNFRSPAFLVKVQSEKAPVPFEVLVKGGLSLRCALQFQTCIKQFHSEVTVSEYPISLGESLHNSWPKQAHIDYGSTHTNHMWQSKISAMYIDVGWCGQNMTRKTTENLKTSTIQTVTGARVLILGGVVMVVKKQDIQDSGGGVWQKFETWNSLHWVQDTYNDQRKPRICIYTSWTEVLLCIIHILCIWFWYLQHIEQVTHQQKLNKYETHRNPENAKAGVLTRQDAHETELLWILDRTKFEER